jgi:O-antigen/teichoic acid export membrane protein
VRLPSAGRLGNVALRGLTLATKLVLFLLLAKLLEPAEVGLFGLVVATIMFVQFALGYEYCKYANRELISAPPGRWPLIIRSQSAFYVATYVVTFPAVLLLFGLDALPWGVAAWFLVLLLLEHVTHEMGRILVAMQCQTQATALLFIRAGAWILVVIPLMWFVPALRSLDSVFAAWAIGAAVAAVIGYARIASIAGWRQRAPVDWAWVKRGVAVSTPFVVATLALKALTTFDRYWLEAIADLQVVAAYVLFVGIANSIRSFLDASVFTFAYPALVKAGVDGDAPRFARALRVMLIEAVGITVLMTALILALIEPLLRWIGKDVYEANLGLLHWTLGATLLYTLGMVAHYGNYARHQDRLILVANLAGLGAFMVCGLSLSDSQGVLAVPMAVCAAYAIILIVKAVALLPRRRAGAGPARGGDRPPIDSDGIEEEV